MDSGYFMSCQITVDKESEQDNSAPRQRTQCRTNKYYCQWKLDCGWYQVYNPSQDKITCVFPAAHHEQPPKTLVREPCQSRHIPLMARAIRAHLLPKIQHTRVCGCWPETPWPRTLDQTTWHTRLISGSPCLQQRSKQLAHIQHSHSIHRKCATAKDKDRRNRRHSYCQARSCCSFDANKSRSTMCVLVGLVQIRRCDTQCNWAVPDLPHWERT